jgi:UDP-N-acetylmuramoyl-L-alanyl-D-glutamate--2,6-diaminopimelate ligase
LRLTDLLDNLVNLPRDTAATDIHDLTIHGLTVNSAAVSKGDLFFALPGSRHDGRDFIDDAVARGAGAIVTDDRPFERQSAIAIPVLQAPNPRQVMAVAAARFWPQQSGMIAAVTGTNGKTSTVEFMRQIWARVNWSAASIGTIGIRGTDTHDTHAPRANIPQLTTPDSISLHATVAAIAKQGVTHLALEASSHGLQQYRLDGLNIHVAGFTNLSRDHLDHHCDMDDYFAAKARLFDEVLSEGGSAVINIDDAYGKKLVSRIKDRPVVVKTFGTSKDADFHIKQISTTNVGLDLQLVYQGKTWHIPLALAGTFQAMNALTAAIMCHMSGLPLHDSLGSLAYLTSVPGRMQMVHSHPEKAQIIVDYAHTPDALAAALAALRPAATGKLVVLFGCGGDRDTGKRAEMGHIASTGADQVFVTDDNPRTEDAASIRAAIIAACPAAIEIASRDKAIAAALASVGSGDVLLIAGKGHETVQLVGNESLPFDDAAIASHLMVQMQKKAVQ